MQTAFMIGATTAALSFVAGCTTLRQSAGTEAVLAPLPGAVAVERAGRGEDAVVEYQLAEPFPAHNTVARLRAALEQAGWQEMSLSITGDSLEMGESPQWTYSEDAVREPNTKYEWHAQWRDAGGRVVWYVLTYEAQRSASGYEAIGSVHVTGTLLAADSVRRLREAAAGGS